MNADAITDAERYPTLTEDGRRMLEFLREHPHAPIFRNQSGNRLTADEVSRVREFERDFADEPSVVDLAAAYRRFRVQILNIEHVR